MGMWFDYHDNCFEYAYTIMWWIGITTSYNYIIIIKAFIAITERS